MEPMDEVVKSLCIRLAGRSPGTRAKDAGEGAPLGLTPSSRRGFLGTIGKLTVGAAAVAGGATLFNHPAEAATALHCCEGIACGFHGCLHGMAIGYTWSCGGYFCHDCFTDSGNGNYYCTYTVARTTTTHYTTRATTHHAARRRRTMTYYTPPEYYAPENYAPPPGYVFYGSPPGFFGG